MRYDTQRKRLQRIPVLLFLIGLAVSSVATRVHAASNTCNYCGCSDLWIDSNYHEVYCFGDDDSCQNHPGNRCTNY